MKRSLFLIVPLFLVAISCRKNKNTAAVHTAAPYTGCRIVKIYQTFKNNYNEVTGTTIAFFYNDDETISKVTTVPDNGVNSYEKDFVYAGNYILVTAADGPGKATTERDSLALDANGRIVYIDHYGFDGAPHNFNWDSYQYDSLGEMVFHIEHSYNLSSSENYQWRNGDLQWNTVGTTLYTYVYDAREYNVGNICANLYDLEQYGRSIYVSRHLPVMAIVAKTDTVSYDYTLDNTGKLTGYTQTETGNYVTTVQITYACQ